MKRSLFWLVITLVTVFSLGSVSAEPNMNPGKWEITTKTEMVGVPGMQIPPETHTQCLSKSELVPQSKGSSQECRISDVRQEGNRVLWKIVCSGRNGEMEGTGTVTYNGDTMTGTMEMVIKGAGMRIKNEINGRRIGDCN